MGKGYKNYHRMEEVVFKEKLKNQYCMTWRKNTAIYGKKKKVVKTR